MDRSAIGQFLQDVLRARMSSGRFLNMKAAVHTIKVRYQRLKRRRAFRSIVEQAVSAQILTSQHIANQTMSEQADDFFQNAVDEGSRMRIMSAFDTQSLGSKVVLSPDRLSAMNTWEDASIDSFCIAFGNGRMPATGEGLYCEVKIDQTIDGEADGLTLGVTLETPENFLKTLPPEMPDDIPRSWSIGYNGQAFSCNLAEMTPVDWQPACLKTGDRLGLLVDRGGHMWLHYNGRRKTRAPDKIPVTLPLYPFFGIIGNTRAITLIPGAEAENSTRNSVVAARIGRPFDEQGFGKLGALPGLKTHRPDKTGILPAFGPTAFVSDLASEVVKVSDDGLTATHQKPQGTAFQGIVFGNSPIQVSGSGAYFEVQINITCMGEIDGLVIGVTTSLPPRAPKTPFESADMVPNSWCFGFDGIAILDSGKRRVPLSWSARDLQPGDRVGLLVSPWGEAKVQTVR
eukprot:TRINITY_DN9391_c0_g1_i3.p1 TRINITY_DN9391_c0_g1~~TRINITY_DN9391_c0_g1_i3.p1  ORF type:complete len:457 (+),score=75.78 TRINITY_DN9391_c0_g1_i3:113-1483(+)